MTTPTPKTGKGSFWGKRGINGFDKNPQNINRKGRPRSLFRQLLEEGKANGERLMPTKNDITQIITMFSDMTMEELQKIAEDEKQNFFVRRLARYIGSAEDSEVITFLLDRIVWRPTQSAETIVNVQNNNLEFTDQNIAFFRKMEEKRKLLSGNE